MTSLIDDVLDNVKVQDLGKVDLDEGESLLFAELGLAIVCQSEFDIGGRRQLFVSSGRHGGAIRGAVGGAERRVGCRGQDSLGLVFTRQNRERWGESEAQILGRAPTTGFSPLEGRCQKDSETALKVARYFAIIRQIRAAEGCPEDTLLGA